MKLPRELSGYELADALGKHWGYRKISQEGSHIILETLQPLPHRISIPAHRQLRIGTLNSILRSISRHKGVSRQDILDSF